MKEFCIFSPKVGLELYLEELVMGLVVQELDLEVLDLGLVVQELGLAVLCQEEVDTILYYTILKSCYKYIINIL